MELNSIFTPTNMLVGCVCSLLACAATPAIAEAPSAEAIDALRKLGTHVVLHEDGSLLHVSTRGLPENQFYLLTALADLPQLSVMKPPLTDEGCKAIGQLKNLSQLSIEGATITEKGVSEILSLPALDYLFIENSSIIVGDPTVLKKQRPASLRYCRLGSTAIDDELIEVLARCPSLRVALFSNCKLTDARLARILPSPQLSDIELSHEPGITDRSVDTLLELDGLREVWIRRTGITPKAADDLRIIRPKWRLIYAPSLEDRGPESPDGN